MLDTVGFMQNLARLLSGFSKYAELSVMSQQVQAQTWTLPQLCPGELEPCV